jgi:hypothetical protein
LSASYAQLRHECRSRVKHGCLIGNFASSSGINSKDRRAH